jgi:hypothetical protein
MSVKSTPLGIYYIDDEAKSINIFNGKIESLSEKLGLRTWMTNNHID